MFCWLRSKRVPANRNSNLVVAPPSAYTTDQNSVIDNCAGRFGLIAGNGTFPVRFVKGASRLGVKITAVCYIGETDPAIESYADEVVWIKVGELGKLINSFTNSRIKYAAMAGGINRVKLFGGVKLDARGALLLAKLRSTKDDVIMRGIADELLSEGIEIVSSTIFLTDCLASKGVLTKSKPSREEWEDIRVGKKALRAMSGEDIGQLVVVREGVVVAVEAVEGTDAAIIRGGELGGKGCVVVKFAKATQDIRFDVPTVGIKTLETIIQAKVRVLALEAERTLIMDKEEVIRLADAKNIAILGEEM